MSDPRCAKCGHPRSNHPYRHMFVGPFVGPSKQDTIDPLQAERDAWRARAEAAEENVGILQASREALEAHVAQLQRELAKAHSLGPSAKAEANLAVLVKAATVLKADMLERAQIRIDVIMGEKYRVVNAGNGAWSGFCAALAALEGNNHD